MERTRPLVKLVLQASRFFQVVGAARKEGGGDESGDLSKHFVFFAGM